MKLERVSMNSDCVILLDIVFSLFGVLLVLVLISFGYIWIKEWLGY